MVNDADPVAEDPGGLLAGVQSQDDGVEDDEGGAGDLDWQTFDPLGQGQSPGSDVRPSLKGR